MGRKSREQKADEKFSRDSRKADRLDERAERQSLRFRSDKAAKSRARASKLRGLDELYYD